MGEILKSLIPAYGGYSIAREDKVILIKGAVPGELVEVEILEKKKDYSIGVVINVLEPSEHRVEPRCPVFGLCGGCHLQYVSYVKQLAMKDEILLDSLTRIGGIETALEPPLVDLQWHYRHRAQFKVSSEGKIGFFRESTREVVPIETCPLMNEQINNFLLKVQEKDILHHIRELHVSAGNTPVCLLRGRDYDMSLLEGFIDAGMSGIAYNDTAAYGGDYTGFDLNSLRYTVSPWTFFQSHWSLNLKVVGHVLEKVLPLKGQHVLDLYAGAGNFSLPLAAEAAEVVAVEESPYAVDDGKRNLELNEIKNCRIIKSSAEKFRITRKFDLIVLDPPRPGLTSEVVKKVLDNPPDRIVYISCNPATLARDLKKLKEKYELESMRQIDFFPNTFHIESLAFLRIR